MIRIGDQDLDLSAFFYVAAIWAALALTFAARTDAVGTGTGLTKGLGFLVLSLGNLIFLVKLIEVITKLMSDQPTEKRGLYPLQVFVWANLKLLSLGGLFFLIWKYGNQVLLPALFCGVGTLIVVPLAGGLWWSRTEKG